MSLQHDLLLLCLLSGYHANPFLLEHDLSSLLVDPAARPIIGGDVAPPGSAPHMVALLYKGKFICGGSLISSRTVLTAAHCVDGVEVSLYQGLVGTNHLNSSGIKISFEKKIVHPDWNKKLITNDVALLITTEAVQFSELVKPVTLSYQHVGGGVEVKVTGWGRTGDMEPVSNELLQLFMTSVDSKECRKAIKKDKIDPVSMVCALHSVNHGMCRGDSGSALVRRDSGEQVGVASWVIAYATGVPDVFARVSAFQHFIETNKVQ